MAKGAAFKKERPSARSLQLLTTQIIRDQVIFGGTSASIKCCRWGGKKRRVKTGKKDICQKTLGSDKEVRMRQKSAPTM